MYQGGRYGYVWFGSNICILIFVFFCVPVRSLSHLGALSLTVCQETKDRTLEEIDEMFEEKVPALKFKRYECVRSNNPTASSVENHQKDEETVHLESL